MAKLLRSRKQFGRCRVEGHGDNWMCEPIAELQTMPFTRAQDKREARKEIDEELSDKDKVCFNFRNILYIGEKE